LSLSLRVFTSTPTVKFWKDSKRGFFPCNTHENRYKLQYSAKIWGSHCGVAEDSVSLRYDAATTGSRFPTFRGNIAYSDSRVDTFFIVLLAGIAQSVQWLYYWLDNRNRSILGGGKIFFKASRTALGPSQPPIQRVPKDLCLGVKQPRREADHTPSFSATVKNEWICTDTTMPEYAVAVCVSNFTCPVY
jgi:hypothetical protein